MPPAGDSEGAGPGRGRAGAPVPLLHVGYVKTGSTWLQTDLFARPEGPFFSLASGPEIVSQLIVPGPLAYGGEPMRALLAPRLAEAESRGRVPVLSHERLSGNPFSGGFDAVTLAHRLSDLFAAARILIVVREQRDMVLSVYKQFVREGGASPIGRFLSPPPGPKIPLFDPVFLEYHRLIALYRRLFGEGQVSVIPFERLREAPLEFATAIVAPYGLPPVERVSPNVVYRSLPNAAVSLLSRTNLLFYRDRTNPNAWLHAPRLTRAFGRLARLVTPGPVDRRLGARFREEIGRRLGNAYVESNRCLQELVPYDLKRYGYMM